MNSAVLEKPVEGSRERGALLFGIGAWKDESSCTAGYSKGEAVATNGCQKVPHGC